MKLIKALLVLSLLGAIALASWYFRPWSEYSPHKVAALQDPSKFVSNFRNMGKLLPHKRVAKGQITKALKEQLEAINPSYNFDGRQRLLSEYLDESVTTGLLVLKDGVIRHEQYWRGANRESLLTSWSVAKSFVATAIAMAQHEGLIESLDDPAEKYALQYAGSDFGMSSLNSLLAMSTGLDFIEDYASEESDIRPFFFNSFILGKNPDSLLLDVSRNRAAFTDFDYISPNSQVLSAVLRAIYKKPLAEIIAEKIWQPMGMEADATWLQHRNDKHGVALGYCCLNARLRDYARFGQFYLDTLKGDGFGVTALSQSWVSSLSSPASEAHAPGGTKYAGRGYSWHFWLPAQRRGIFFASGVYGQTIWIDSERNLVIVKTSADNSFSTRFRENEVAFEAISRVYD